MRSIYLSIVGIAIWLLSAVNVNAQTAVTLNWNFTAGTGACATTPPTGLTVGNYTIGNSLGTVATPISTATASTGYSGATGTYNIGNAAATGALNVSGTTNAYFQVVVTPDAANYFTFSGINFGTRSTSTGPQAYTVRTSLDNYATDIATGTISNNSTWVLKSNTFTNPLVGGAGVAFTIRIYGYSGAGSASSGTINWKLDDINILGTLTPANTPLLSTTPTSLAFGSKCINQNYVDSFVINALNLTSTNVDIAALSGFSYATSLNGTYTSTLSISQAGGAFSQKIYTKFSPMTSIAYNGAVVISGGGLSNPTNVSITASGISTAPTVTTTTATFVTTSDAILNATNVAAGCGSVSSYSIEYSTTPNFTSGTGTIVAGSNLNSGVFSVSISNLQSSTVYYFKSSVTNSNGLTTVGSELSFTTLGLAPTITASTLSNFGSVCTNTNSTAQSFNITGVNLTNANVQVGPINGFIFSTNPSSTFTDSLVITQSGGTFTQVVYVEFKPLSATTYSSSIPVIGGGATATLVSASGIGIATLPALSTSSPISISYNGATIGGTISVLNCGGITSYGIEYGTSSTLASGTALAASSNLSNNTYSAVISGLVANTVYYYRAYAITGNGTTTSSILSFTTSNIPFPSNLSGINITTNSYVANWDAVSGASNYRLDVSQSSTFTNSPSTIVGWGMGVAASKIADTSVSMNANDSLITFGGTNTPTYNVTGSIGTARADGWQSGNGVKGWEVNFATTGYYNIRVSSKQRSSSSGPKNFKLQYRIGTSGSYSDVTGADVVTADNYTTGVLNNITLPATCENQPVVYLRWIMSSNTAVNNTAVASTGASNIDNISIVGGLQSFLPGYNNRLENGLNDSVTGLSPNTTYYMRVRSEAPTSVSVNSPIVAVTTNCVPPVFSGVTTNATCGGSSTGSIDVTVSGTGTFTYSWTGSNGFTATTQDINNIAAGSYSVTVTSGVCTASNTFVVYEPTTLAANPTISVTSVCAGSTANITANATGGTGAYSYFWLGPNGFIDFSANPSFTTSVNSVGAYSLFLTDSLGCTANASTALSSVTPSATPSATISTNYTTVCAGSLVTFTSITTDGGTTPGYQWMLNGNAISGETNDTYVTSSLIDGDIVSLAYTTSATCYTILTGLSNNIAMTVIANVNPSLVITPDANPVCPGAAMNFTSLEEGGGTTPSYQWYLNGFPINGETNATYSSPTPTDGDVVSLMMISSAVCIPSPIVNSNNVTISVGTMVLPTVTISASANPICAGNTLTLTSSVINGGLNPSYQWNLNGSPISGATNDTYSTSSINSGDNYSLDVISNAACLISNYAGSNTISMSVLNPVGTILASGPLALCSGGHVTLSAGAGNTYLWSNGATSSSIVVSTAGNYSVSYTNVDGCLVTAAPAKVISKTMPSTVKIKMLGAATVCQPATVSFVVDPSAASLYGFDFQWNVANTPILGATDTAYTAVNPGTGGVTLTVSGSTCSKSSSAKNYTIKPLPVATFSAGGPTTICAGQSVTLIAPTITGYSYTWLNNGVSAGSGASKVFKTAGSYTVIASLGGCKDTANNSINVVVNPIPVAAITNLTPSTFCQNDSCILTATPTGASNYAWINGSVTTNTSVPNYTAFITGTYKVAVTDMNGCVSKTSSSSVKTKMNPNPAPTITASSSTTIPATGSVKLNAVPSSGYTFQWYRNGVAIPTATTKTYVATVSGSYQVEETKLGCVGISAGITVIKTGVKEQPSNGITSDASFEFLAYPNPVNDLLTIRVNGIDNVNASITILDAVGKIINTFNMNENNLQVDMNSYTSGVYFVQYKDADGKSGTLKIVKQ